MKIRSTTFALAAAATTLSAISVPAQAAPGSTDDGKRIFRYFLPQTKVLVEVTQTLESCPDNGSEPEVSTEIVIKSERQADPDGLVMVDVGAGFLAKRTSRLELNDDGTLSSFNSENEGQGGALIGSLVKTAAMVVKGRGAFAARGVRGPESPSASGLACTAEILDLGQRFAALSKRISDLEKLIETGVGEDAQIALLDQLRTRRAKLKAAFSLTTYLTAPLVPKRAGDGIASPVTLRGHVPAVAYAQWFGPAATADVLYKAGIAGRHGFKVEIGPDATFNTLRGGIPAERLKEPISDLVYRQTVLGKVTVTSCGDAAGANCQPDGVEAAADAQAIGRISLPQLSPLYTIKTGKGGVFGSRQAGAKFGADGAPRELQYGSVSAAADLATLSDTVRDSAESLRDSELKDIKRQIELEEARKQLATLQAEAATAKTEE